MSFRAPDVLERRNNAAAVKKAMLEKFRAVTQDPVLAEQQRLKRIAINEARDARMAEREAARKVREAELAAQAAREAELAAQAATRGRGSRGARQGRSGRTRAGARRRAKSRARCPLCRPQGRQKGPPPRLLTILYGGYTRPRSFASPLP